MLYKFKRKEGVNSITEAHLKNLGLNSVQDINNWFKRSIADQNEGFTDHSQQDQGIQR